MRVSAARQAGFTLIELALVLVLVSIILAGALSSVGGVRDNARYAEIDAYLEQARQSLIDYMLTHHHLPCPDSLDDDDSGTQNTVLQSTGNTCEVSHGELPWRDLGLDPTMTAGWQKVPLYYVNESVVNTRCSNGNNETCYFENEDGLVQLTTPPTATDDGNGNLTVENRAGDELARNVIAVVLALGENSALALQDCDELQPAEIENCDNDANFVMDNLQVSEQGVLFDDQLIWLDATSLKGKMRDAGLL